MGEGAGATSTEVQLMYGPGRTSTIPGTCEGKRIILARDDFRSGIVKIETLEDKLCIEQAGCQCVLCMIKTAYDMMLQEFQTDGRIVVS